MLEKEIEKYFVEQIRKVGGKAYKFISTGNVGVPDRIVVLPGGRVEFVEMKAEKGKLTEMQAKQIKKLESLGVKVTVINSKSKVDEYINKLGGEAT